MATEGFDSGFGPIQTVTRIASDKIGKATTLLNEYRTEKDDRPAPEAVAARIEVVTQTKRKGK
jgi:hypothetical protein